MSNAIKIIVISLTLSLFNVALSKLGYINLIWIFVLAFFLTENEDFALVFSVVGGCLYDVLMHNNIGETSLSILAGILIFLVLRAIISTDNIYFRLFSVIMVMIAAFATKYITLMLVDGVRYQSYQEFFFWWKHVISHSIFTGIVIGILGGMRGVINPVKKIKIK